MENQSSNAYLLSIRISPDGFFLTVSEESGLELTSKQVTASLLNLHADVIKALIEAEITVNFSKVRLVFESNSYVFVPASLFDQQESAGYLNFQQKVPKSERVVFNAIPAWDTVNVFTIPVAVLQALMDVFPGVSIEHHMTAMLTDHVLRRHESELHLGIRAKMLDMILLKDNHVDFAGGIDKAINRAKEYCKTNNKDLKIEIEVRSFDELQQVLDLGGVDRIMFDNFTPEMTRKAVEMVNGSCETESSGGITFDMLRDYAECGVDFISVGALTHSVKGLDMSFKAC